LPGESVWVCLVAPIRTPWFPSTVVGAELLCHGSCHVDLRFMEPLPDDFLTAIAAPPGEPGEPSDPGMAEP
jgi:hypothetical protein